MKAGPRFWWTGCAGGLAAGACVFSLATAITSAARADARAVKGPYLTSLTETSVDVRFELDTPELAALVVSADGSVDAGLARRTLQSAAAPDLRIVHVAGLAPGTRYSYTLSSAHAPIASGHFTTAPDANAGARASEPVTFLVYGDDRSDPDAHQAVVRALANAPSDFLVNTGDLVADGASAADWQSFFTIEAPILRERALFVAIGNHELYEDRAGANFIKYFGFPAAPSPRLYGTARWGSVRFFFLNAQHDWNEGEERAWLEQALASADHEAGLVWRIAVTHHGAWSSGPHGPNANLVSAHIPELLAAHGVDLLVSGHDHIYERGEWGEPGDRATLKYIVSGGGGAPLYPIGPRAPGSRKAESAYHFVEFTASSDTIRIVARRAADGSVLDRCGFAKGKPWDCDPPAPPPPPPHALHAAEAPATPTQASAARCACVLPGAPAGAGAAGGAIGVVCALGAGLLSRRRRFALRSRECVSGEDGASARQT
jgi:hypothetical protein